MPKEFKKRGRRGEEKKRKRDAHDSETRAKRHKKTSDDVPAEGQDFIALDGGDAEMGEAPADEAFSGMPRPDEMPFYGMLDEGEQEYFKKADELLELNQFESPEDRAIFLENVYKEADGKELKIANSQSCSRLMERLILLSTPAQLKSLFKKFSGQ